MERSSRRAVLPYCTLHVCGIFTSAPVLAQAWTIALPFPTPGCFSCFLY